MKNYNAKSIENTNIKLLIKAAEKNKISCTMIDDDRYQILLEKDKKAHIITNHGLKINLQSSLQLVKNKYLLAKFFKKAGIPVLSKITISSQKQYLKNYSKIPFPQVIKPVAGEKGRQVFLNIKDKKSALAALKILFQHYKNALIEPYFSGHDLRILVLNHQVIGISERKPPQIIGDGKNTTEKLIQKENQRRIKLNKKAGFRMLNRIVDIPRITWYLKKQNLNLQSILPKGKKQKLHQIPNYSAGGSVTTINKKNIHQSFITLSKKISYLVKLKVVGIDFIIKDLKKPANNKNSTVLELNSDPGIRLHDIPNKGISQNIAEKIVKYFFESH